MKKRIFALLTAALMCCTLVTGCSFGAKGKLESQTVELMEAIKATDDAGISKVMGKTDGSAADVSSIAGDESEYPQTTEAIMNIIKTHNKNLVYEIKDIDTKNLTVTVSVTYDDISNVLDEFMTVVTQKAMSSAAARASLTTDAGIAACFTEADNTIEAAGDFTQKTEEITLQFTKSGKNYILTDATDDELQNILTGNMLDNMDKLTAN